MSTPPTAEHVPSMTMKKVQEPVNIALSCADFRKFSRWSDLWTSFKENTLSKAGVGGYAQYFRPDFKGDDTKWETKEYFIY
jgi:hypothetical protein